MTQRTSVPSRPPSALVSSSEEDKALPLPGWLVKVYFIFPIILYIPDAIFNYYVYSDGAYIPNAPLPVQISQIALWGFLSIGVVGMAYLLSVLAPWHWSNGHRLQAFFCWIGVLVATGITTWNSLSYRSGTFNEFATDRWLYQVFPALASSHISLTMVLVAIAPPFWGLFWALVQPTQHRRSLRQLNEGHAEKLLRVQHEAELKRLRAESNAQVREAQLKGMAQTAAAARAQAGHLFSRRTDAQDDPPPPAEPTAARHAALPTGQLPGPPGPRAGTLGEPPAQRDASAAAPPASPATSMKPSRAKSPAKASATRVATPSVSQPSQSGRAAASALSATDDGDLARGRLDHVTVPGDELRVLDAVYRAPRP